MYLWKCWRDTRAHFIGSLLALPALCVLFTVLYVKLGDPDALRKGTPTSLAQAWSTVTEFVLGGWAGFFALSWGLVLGSGGLGEEFKERTADFLLVRPRRRRYWVWMGWLVGVCEISAMVILAVAATFGTLVYSTGHLYTWRPLATILPLAVGGSVVYGMTCFMTLIARSGRQGLSYGIGILFIDLLLPAAVYYYWSVNFPSVLGFMMTASHWVTSASWAFPTTALILWSLISLAFPLATQWMLERAEV